MINSVIVANGYASELPGLKMRRFQFTDKLNVLFGPNGCGKSTLLNIIKAYNGIEKGGWSKLTDNQNAMATSASHFPLAYHIYSPGRCQAIVEWDGTATFYNNGDIKVDEFAWFFNKAAQSEDGMTTEKENMEFMTNKPSSGQYRMLKINKIFNMLGNAPDLTIPTGSVSVPESQYIRSLPRNSKHTLLLDEPERALSIPKQIELFNLLVEFSEHYQIIVATHSPFVLFGMDANIIDFDPNYSAQCVEMLKGLVNK